jgi:hypothetical protein
MIISNHKSIEEENIPFRIHPSKDHSHSLAPRAPAFLAGATGHRKKVPKKEGQQHLYSPPSGHPRDPPLGTCLPPLGPVHPPLGTRPGIRLPCLHIGYRGAPSSLRRATPSRHSIALLRRATPSGPPSQSLYKYPCLP